MCWMYLTQAAVRAREDRFDADADADVRRWHSSTFSFSSINFTNSFITYGIFSMARALTINNRQAVLASCPLNSFWCKIFGEQAALPDAQQRPHSLDLVLTASLNWRLKEGPSLVGWLVGWGLTALLTQNRSYRACRFVGIFYSKL